MNRFAPALLLVLAACAADVGDGKTAAKVEETPAAPVTPPGGDAPAAAPVADPLKPAGATVLAVDVAKSKLGGTAAKVTAQHPLVFHKFQGAVGLDGDAVKGVGFVADVTSLEADVAKLTAHLQKADFLDTANFPSATFSSVEVTPAADAAGNTHTVTGDLTIRGVTKRVSFPAKITVTPAEVDASTEFVINRRDFGVVYPGMPDDLIQDNVALSISFVAPRS